MSQLEKVLQQYWGHRHFRPLQKEIIATLLAGKDVLVLMPTGGGKSLCFQLPTLVKGGVCLVISPLIALMMDQVQQLREKGIKALALHTGMRPEEVDIALDNCVYGDVSFLYVAPERLNNELFLTRLKRMNITFLAVDEAHCISEWGYDFRPAYLSIAALRDIISPAVPVVALTATAPPAVVDDILDKLKMENAALFQHSFVRPNLVYVVRKVSTKERALVGVLQRVEGSTIVYVSTRDSAENIAHFLVQKGFRADFYHGKLTSEERYKKQQAWLEGRLRIIVATNAFGMGIDKKDVRLVVHIDMPTTLEAYYQEAGRAGRDGQKSYAVVFSGFDTFTSLKKRVKETFLSPDQLRNIYQLLSNYYQVAVGSHDKKVYSLDIEDCSSLYQLNKSTLRTAIRQLQSAGLVHYEEGFAVVAKVHITLSPTDFYHWKVQYPQYQKLLDALLSLYQGRLFKKPTPISLKRLSRFLSISSQVVSQQLVMLNKLGVLLYTPANHLPKFSFATYRYPVQELPIPVAQLKNRQDIVKQKLADVMAYLDDELLCRAAFLVDYLGEKKTTSCMMCDRCLAKKKENRVHYKKAILKLLEEESLTAHELSNRLAQDSLVPVTAALEELLQEHSVSYDENGWLRKKR